MQQGLVSDLQLSLPWERKVYGKWKLEPMRSAIHIRSTAYTNKWVPSNRLSESQHQFESGGQGKCP